MVSAQGLSRMIVTHVIKITRVAGAENHLLMLVAGLRARQIDAHIVMLIEPANPMDDFVYAAQNDAIPIHTITINGDMDLTLLPRLRQLLRRLKPQIVHTHLQHADLYGIPAARMAGVPVVISSRHNDNNFRRHAPVKQVNQTLWRMVDGGIAISDAIARFAIEVEGAPTRKIHTILYGLSVNTDTNEHETERQAFRLELGIGKDDLVAGVVCRLVEQKGVIYALQAFQKIAKKFPSAHLVIAGDGPLRQSLAGEVIPLGLQGQVHFLGWRDDISLVMAGLDVLVVPSLWEGFGLVILEAMARQVPTIASAVSAIPEIIVDGETGLLVPPRDVDALAGALETMFADHALRRHMGLLAEDRLEAHFSAEQMVDQTIALYNQLLASRKN
jgi:glycosyltransferase involved in cell wall biosynthesis